MSLTLVKETGSGLTNANAYASAADGDTYHDGHLYGSAWTGATTGTKEAALVMATRIIDGTFDFRGFKTLNTQALQWPRQMCVDPDRADVRWTVLQNNQGPYLDSDKVPKPVSDATCELARELIKADTTDAKDGEGLDSLALGGMTFLFNKKDAQPLVTRLAQMFLAKYGSYRVSTSGSVRLKRV